MAEVLIGAKELERRLAYLAGEGSSRVARAGTSAMATPLKQGIRRQVNAASVDPGMKKAVRTTIGSKVKRNADGSYGLKAGLGVGKPSKAKKAKARERASGSRPGVGISSANIHWVILGTANRRTKGGAYRGRLPAQFAGVVPNGVASAIPAAMEKSAEKAKIALHKEALKRR